MVHGIKCKSNELGIFIAAVEKADEASSSIMDSRIVLDEIGIPVPKRSKNYPWIFCLDLKEAKKYLLSKIS